MRILSLTLLILSLTLSVTCGDPTVSSDGTKPITVASKGARPAKTVPLLRYWNSERQDHLYVTDFKILGDGKHGYLYQGVEAYVIPRPSEEPTAPKPVVATKRKSAGGGGPSDLDYTEVLLEDGPKKEGETPVPLYRYFDRASNDHYYSTDKAATEGTRIYEGIECLVLPKSSTARGTVSLHSYYHPVMKDHMLTTDITKLGVKGKDGWKYLGSVGRVYPRPSQVESENPGDGSTVAIRRYFNHITADHLLTSARSQDDHAWYGWMYQGISFYCYKEAQPNTVSLKLYYNGFTKDHIVTANQAMLGAAAVNWAYVMDLCYVSLKPGKGLTALYRYFNSDLQDHYYTTDGAKLGQDPKNPKLGWVYQGIECYVLPHALEVAPALPHNKVRASKPVAAFWNSRYRTHAYTTDSSEEKRLAGDGKRFGWSVSAAKKPSNANATSTSPAISAAFYVFAKHTEGTTPLYGFFDHVGQDFFYTNEYTDDADSEPADWRSYRGIVGYIDISETAGSVPLYRYYNDTIRDTMVSTTLFPASTPYKYEGILGFVPSARVVGEDAAKKVKSGISADLPINLHRAPLLQFADSQGRHFYTADREYDTATQTLLAQRRTMHNTDTDTDNSNDNSNNANGGHIDKHAEADFFYQGVAAYCHRTHFTGTIPLYVFRNAQTGTAAYSTAADEFSRTNGWSEPKVTCYVTDHRVEGSVPLRRFVGEAEGIEGDHLYLATASAPEKATPEGYRYEGIQAWTFPSAVHPMAPHDLSHPVKIDINF